MNTPATSAPAIGTEPRLSWHEGEALRVAEGLVGKGRAAPPDGLPLDEPSPALATAVARTFAAACGRFVVEHGARARTVLRDGRRAEGRIWDAHLNAGFALTLTKDTDALWWRCVKDLLPLAAKKRHRVNADTIDNTREDRRILRAAVPMLTHGSGDALVFLLAHEHASYLRLPRALELAFQQALREASPLARLWAPDDAAPKEALVRKRVQDAVTDHARVLELVDEPLATSWLQRLGALVLHSADLADLRARAQTFALTLNTLIDTCNAARMTHLLRPVALFLARAHVDAIPERFDVRAHAVRVPGVTSMSDRDEVLQLVGAIHAAARRLDELRARLVRERYGDERHEEAQVVVRMLDDVLAPQRQGIDTLARRLSGAVG